MAGSAAVLSLNAVGRQDTYFDGKDSFFKFNQLRHSNFTKFQRSTKIKKPTTTTSQTWPFGETIQVTLNPQQMGDLLCNMYLKCTLPANGIEPYRFSYAADVGKALIETMELRVDEYELETLYTDWSVIYNELYMTEEEKDGLRNLDNNGKPSGTMASTPGDGNESGVKIFVPLHFFFGRRHSTQDFDNKLLNDKYFKPYFPLCAIHKQKIFLNIRFNNKTFFTNSQPQIDMQLAQFEIITEEITLSHMERSYIVNNKQTITTELMRRQSPIDIDSFFVEAKNNLVPNIPVKTLHWFFRRDEFENNPDEIANRFNYGNYYSGPTTTSNIYIQAENPIMSDAELFINGTQNLGFMKGETRSSTSTANYFKQQVPFKVGLSAPLRNVYTYSFSLKPKDPLPTGALDFSQLNSDKTFLLASLMETGKNSTASTSNTQNNVIATLTGTIVTTQAGSTLTVTATSNCLSNLTIVQNDLNVYTSFSPELTHTQELTLPSINNVLSLEASNVLNGTSTTTNISLVKPPLIYKYHLYYTGYQTLSFEDGFLTPMFST
tara:strand:+ start:5982 stop:7628 length:1647 start_codon:yes stop_codon:yes gene_type:complete